MDFLYYRKTKEDAEKWLYKFLSKFIFFYIYWYGTYYGEEGKRGDKSLDGKSLPLPIAIYGTRVTNVLDCLPLSIIWLSFKLSRICTIAPILTDRILIKIILFL